MNIDTKIIITLVITALALLGVYGLTKVNLVWGERGTGSYPYTQTESPEEAARAEQELNARAQELENFLNAQQAARAKATSPGEPSSEAP